MGVRVEVEGCHRELDPIRSVTRLVAGSPRAVRDYGKGRRERREGARERRPVRDKALGLSLPARGGRPPRSIPATAAAIATGSSHEHSAETEGAKDCGAARKAQGRKE